MTAANLNIRTDKEIKDQAEQIFNELGLNMTTAVNLFLRAVNRENGIPSSLKPEVPGVVTAAAIKEGRRIASDSSGKRDIQVWMRLKMRLKNEVRSQIYQSECQN